MSLRTISGFGGSAPSVMTVRLRQSGYGASLKGPLPFAIGPFTRAVKETIFLSPGCVATVAAAMRRPSNLIQYFAALSPPSV